MHDTPQVRNENPEAATIDSLIADLASADAADAPDIADEIAVRLEAELTAANSTSPIDPAPDRA